MADIRDADKLIATGSGSLTAQDQAVTLTLNGQANATFQLTGTWSATVTFEASNDNSNWTSVFAMKAGDNVIAATATANDIYRCTTAGFGYVRARCSAYTSGTIVITANAVSQASGVFLNFPLPPGTNSLGVLGANSGVDIGDVTINNASGGSAVNIQDGGNAISVDWDGTQPVTGSGTATGALRVELANNGTGVVATVSTLTGGGVADDGTTPGNPIMVGGFAISPDGTDPGSVSTEADVARFRTDLNRRLLVNGEHPNWWSYHEDSSSALTDTTVKAAPGAGLQIVITEIMFSTGAATACNIFFEEGSTKVLGPWYLEAVAGRGVFWKGLKHITANTAVTVTTSAAIAHSIDIQGYIQAV